MAINIGDVVMLKSGGQALTVIEIEDGQATCVWIGEDGDFFRERIPELALTALAIDDLEEDDDEDSEEGGDGEDSAQDEDDEEDERTAAKETV